MEDNLIGAIFPEPVLDTVWLMLLVGGCRVALIRKPVLSSRWTARWKCRISSKYVVIVYLGFGISTNMASEAIFVEIILAAASEFRKTSLNRTVIYYLVSGSLEPSAETCKWFLIIVDNQDQVFLSHIGQILLQRKR